MYKAIIVKLKDVREHPNADRLQLATCCGNTVIVGLDAQQNDLGVYFDVDGQLSHDFVSANNLYRKEFALKNQDPSQSGMFDENRRVRAMSLRGTKSIGFWAPVSYMNFALSVSDSVNLEEGFEFSSVGGIEICNKYITKATRKKVGGVPGGKKAERDNKMFSRHFDTPQLGRVVGFLSESDQIIITEKVHGTSQRVGYVKEEYPRKWWHRLLGVVKAPVWKHIIGTRRVQLSDTKIQSGFYDGKFRQSAAEEFIGKLNKGEVVYYEVVGYHDSDGLIMPRVSNTKLKSHLDKKDYNEFIAQFGDETQFTYGCHPGEFKNYVYRITQVNEDGHAVDLSWEQVVHRCEEMEVNAIPQLFKGSVKDVVKAFNKKAYYEMEIMNGLVDAIDNVSQGQSSLAPHLTEGVCVRCEGYPRPFVAKHKNFHFKVVEGIIKDTGVADIEESS